MVRNHYGSSMLPRSKMMLIRSSRSSKHALLVVQQQDIEVGTKEWPSVKKTKFPKKMRSSVDGFRQLCTAKERRDERGNERFAKCLKKSPSKALKGLNNDFVAVDISGG